MAHRIAGTNARNYDVAFKFWAKFAQLLTELDEFIAIILYLYCMCGTDELVIAGHYLFAYQASC